MCSVAKILAYMSRSCELHPDPGARAPLQDTMPPVCEKQPANKKNHPNADRLLEFLFSSFTFMGTKPQNGFLAVKILLISHILLKK